MTQKENLTRAENSALKVEIEKKNEIQASDERQDTRQPIKSERGQIINNQTDVSGAYNLVKGSAINLSTSAAIDELNESIVLGKLRGR